MFGPEHGNEIFVPKFVLCSVCGDVVFVLRRSDLIHAARIPFVTECGNRIDTPMNENTELCVPVPIVRDILLQRLPVRTERTFLVNLIDLLQERGAFSVILAAGLLTSLVDANCVLRRNKYHRTLRREKRR